MSDITPEKPKVQEPELQASEGLSLSSAALATWFCLEATAGSHAFGPYGSAASVLTCTGVGALTYFGVRENTKVPVKPVRLDDTK